MPIVPLNNAYSTRSCPASSTTKRKIPPVSIARTPILDCERTDICLAQWIRLRQHCISERRHVQSDLSTDCVDERRADCGDDAAEQRVLDQVLTLFVANEPSDERSHERSS